MDENLEKYLNNHKIKYIEHKHPAVFTVEESKRIDKNIPGLHTKNLFLKNEKSSFYLVCLPADKRLDMKDLKKSLLVKDLRFASADELKKELNLTPGSVSLFGMIYTNSVILIIDKEVWDADIMGFHPNVNTATLEITHENLEKFCNSLKSQYKIISLKSI